MRDLHGATIASGLIVILGLAGLAGLTGCNGASPPPHEAVHDQDHGAVHMEHRFDDVERYAAMFDDPARDTWQMPDEVIEVLGIRPGETVADIGAGTGYFTVRLAAQSPARTVFAVDIEPGMVAHIRDRAEDEGLDNVVAVLAEPGAPDLPEPVDVALIVNTFHHIPDRVGYFTALRSQMTANARLVIVDYRKGAPGAGPPDAFRFTVEQISDELDRAGYRLDVSHEFLPRQHLLVYALE